MSIGWSGCTRRADCLAAISTTSTATRRIVPSRTCGSPLAPKTTQIVARRRVGPQAPPGSRLNPKTGMYEVRIAIGGKDGVRGRQIYLGSYRAPEAAERAYREATEDLHGKFAF